MKCPKCAFARRLSEAICCRCKYVFDQDRFIALEPPRAAKGASPRRFLESRLRGSVGIPQWLPPVASVVPGLGHVLQGRPWVGALYFALAALFGWSSFHLFSQTAGQMLFGLLISTHASSVLDTTPWGRSPETGRRVGARAAALSGAILFYWPLFESLANRFVKPVGLSGYDRGWRPIQVLSTDQIFLMALLFAASVVFWTWLGRRLSRSEY